MELFLSACGLFVLACLGFVLTGVVGYRIGFEKLQSISWIEANRYKIIMLGAPAMIVIFPAFEELIHRLWLIAVFDSMTPVAWVFVVLSSALFAWLHKFNANVDIRDVHAARARGEDVSDDFVQTVSAMMKDKHAMPGIMRRKWVQIVVAFVLGMVCAYVGIVHHSLWLAFLIHAGWNALMLAYGAARPLPSAA